MKNFVKGLVVFGALVLAVNSVSAESADRGGNRDEGRGRERMISRIAEKLDIDTATAQKMQEIMKNGMEARKKLSEELKANMKSLKELVDKGASEAELNAQIDKVEANRDAIHSAMLSGGKEIRQLLGTEKYAKWLVMQGKAMSQMRERRGGQGARNSNRGGRSGRN